MLLHLCWSWASIKGQASCNWRRVCPGDKRPSDTPKKNSYKLPINSYSCKKAYLACSCCTSIVSCSLYATELHNIRACTCACSHGWLTRGWRAQHSCFFGDSCKLLPERCCSRSFGCYSTAALPLFKCHLQRAGCVAQLLQNVQMRSGCHSRPLTAPCATFDK
jgi:hypothetical protein